MMKILIQKISAAKSTPALTFYSVDEKRTVAFALIFC